MLELGVSLKQSRFVKFGFSLLPLSLRLESMQFFQKQWYDRINLTLSCPDNSRIPRVPNAGRVRDGVLTMHNGLLIHRGSYYGETVSVLLELNGGVHEPQEESIFQEVLKFIPPGATMMELGAYWGFYSMWFARSVPSARCLLVEPQSRNLDLGKSNFALNNLQADFLQGWSGSKPDDEDDPFPVYGVDELMERQGIETLNMLHADIQGAEVEMLRTATKAIARGAIDYAFISTHSDQLHEECLRFLIDRGFSIIAEANVTDSFSEDGVIAARRDGISGPPAMTISKRSRQSDRARSRVPERT